MMRIFKIYFLSNFQLCNIVLLAIITMLYISSSWLTHFIIRSLYFLTFIYLETPHLWQPPFLSLHLWANLSWWRGCCFVLFCFVLEILHISKIIQYLSFSVWLISVSVMPSGSIHVIACGKMLFFFTAENILLYMYTTSSYPSIYWCVLR